MNWEKLELKHKELLYDKLRGVDTQLSEYSFANVYLFRNMHKYEICSSDDYTFIKGVTYDGKSFIMPAGDIRIVSCDVLRELQKECDFFFPIPEQWLKKFCTQNYETSSKDGDNDYIYTVEKMCTYKGRKLHKKRNLLKNFKKDHSHEEFPLTRDRMDDARQVLELWQVDVGVSKDETDYYSCSEALDLYDELHLCGVMYYADNEPAGFLIGEELNSETFCIHFAKGLRKFKGLYQYIYNNFANLLPQKYNYLNFEQDLGKTALRIAKSSYVPDDLLIKYRVRFKL